jgi:ribosome-associated protein
METPSDATTYPIRLDQFLKVSCLVGSGGEAKVMVAEGLVKVNGEVELRRGRKLQKGDQVQLGDGPRKEA